MKTFPSGFPQAVVVSPLLIDSLGLRLFVVGRAMDISPLGEKAKSSDSKETSNRVQSSANGSRIGMVMEGENNSGK